MRASLMQLLTSAIIILGHLWLCVATFFPIRSCRFGLYHCPRIRGCVLRPRLCPSPQLPSSCNFNSDGRLCTSVYCLLPQFKCFFNDKCIPRTSYCDGKVDCGDGSDEALCPLTSTVSSASTTLIPTPSRFKETTSLYATPNRTMLPDPEVKTAFSSFTTSEIFFESEEYSAPTSTDNTISSISEENISYPPSTDNTMLSSSKKIISPSPSIDSGVISSSTNNISPSLSTDSMPSSSEKTISPSTSIDSGIISSSTDNISPSLSTDSTILSSTEENISPSPSIDSTILSSTEEHISPLPSIHSAVFSSSEDNISPSPSTDSTMPSSSDENIFPLPSTNNTMPSKSEENISHILPVIDNTILPESSKMQSCPDNYCMQNVECIVVHGQYRCICPFSFIGDFCKKRPGDKQDSSDYTVGIIIFMILVVLCSVVIAVTYNRYRRLSSKNPYVLATKTESQLTLTFHYE